jgi:hypothetical protein
MAGLYLRRHRRRPLHRRGPVCVRGAAHRNSDRPEQDAWWSQASKHLAEVAFHDSTRVHTYREGGSDQAGFVQVIQGYSPDMERLAALGRAREQTMAEQAPHILGMTVAEHADRRG